MSELYRIKISGRQLLDIAKPIHSHVPVNAMKAYCDTRVVDIKMPWADVVGKVFSIHMY